MILNKAVNDKHFVWMFLLFMIYDFLAKILDNYGITHSLYLAATAFKALYISFFLIRDIKFYTKQRTLIVFVSLLLLSVFLGFVCIEYVYNQDEILFNGYYVVAQIFFLILYSVIKNSSLEDCYKVVSIFKIFILINIGLLWIGYFFNINLFRSYFMSPDRFGYTGTLLYHLEAGYILFIAQVVFYFDFMKHKRVIDCIGMILLLISAPMVGTKKYLMLTLLFVLYLTIIFLKKEFLKKKFLKIAAYFSVVTIGLFWVKTILYEKWIIIINVYKENGLITAIFSFRDTLFFHKLIPFVNEKWNMLNYLVGGAAKNFRTELELIDIYFFYGLVGIIVFFFFFRKIYLSLKLSFTKIVLSIILFTACLGGNLLTSLNTAILLFVVLRYIEGYSRIKNSY